VNPECCTPRNGAAPLGGWTGCAPESVSGSCASAAPSGLRVSPGVVVARGRNLRAVEFRCFTIPVTAALKPGNGIANITSGGRGVLDRDSGVARLRPRWRSDRSSSLPRRAASSQYEDRGLVAAVAHKIDAGQIQAVLRRFSSTSEAGSDRNVPPRCGSHATCSTRNYVMDEVFAADPAQKTSTRILSRSAPASAAIRR